MYISIRCSVPTNDYLLLTDIPCIVAISNKLYIRMDINRKFDKFMTSNNHIPVIVHARLFKNLWQKYFQINFLLNNNCCLIPLELIQLQWLRIKNKALTFLMLIPVTCMGYWFIKLGIALWNLKIIFAIILLINRGCSFEVKVVFVRDNKLVLQNVQSPKIK